MFVVNFLGNILSFLLFLHDTFSFYKLILGENYCYTRLTSWCIFLYKDGDLCWVPILLFRFFFNVASVFIFSYFGLYLFRYFALFLSVFCCFHPRFISLKSSSTAPNYFLLGIPLFLFSPFQSTLLKIHPTVAPQPFYSLILHDTHYDWLFIVFHDFYST